MAFLKRSSRVIAIAASLGVLIAAPFFVVPAARHWLEARQLRSAAHAVSVPDPVPRVFLVPGQPETLSVPEDVIRSMGMTFGEVTSALPMVPLKLDGSLFLDTNSMVHVHSRFSGDAVEIGEWKGGDPGDGLPPSVNATRPLQFGDRVEKGQLLAAIWSKDLGEKKSELIESVSRAKRSEQKFKRLEELLDKGAVPERNVREAEREWEADVIGLAKAERTLRSWRLTEPEIESIRHEAEQIRESQGRRTPESDSTWARVEVRAPISGTIVEKNIAVGDYIDSDIDIFKIADLTRMDVLAHAYEEDLPALEKLPLNQRNWTILMKADPKAQPLRGRFDRIGNIIDPSQHTALVMGWVDNSSGKLRVGQFVTAQIDLPTPPEEVAVPVGALVDLDGESFVFTRSASAPDQFRRRRVFPVRRFENFVAIDCAPRHHGQTENCEVDTLKPGEHVATTGGIQLTAELMALQAASQVKVSSAAR